MAERVFRSCPCGRPRLRFSRLFSLKFVREWKMLKTAEDDGGAAGGEEFEEEDEDGGADEHERDAYYGAYYRGGKEGADREQADAEQGQAGGQEHFEARQQARLFGRALRAGTFPARFEGAAAGAEELRFDVIFGNGYSTVGHTAILPKVRNKSAKRLLYNIVAVIQETEL